MIVLPHELYQGEILCPRCGNRGDGISYEICADRGMWLVPNAHALTCERYRYGDELCADCDFALNDEAPDPS